MTAVVDWGLLITWVAASIAAACIIFGVAAGLAAHASNRRQRRRRAARQQQQEWDRHVRTALHTTADNLYTGDPPFTHEHLAAQHERIGKHRAVWETALDNQDADVIAAVVTSVQRRQP